jgi:hypothetical protein
MAALIGVGNSGSWRLFCQRLQHHNLHSRIGKTLALIYATERFYLFELLRPDDFAPNDLNPLADIDVPPARYIAEAEAIAENPDCFAGVGTFDASREPYIGMFHLYVAQLRVAQYTRANTVSTDTALSLIRSDIAASTQLGKHPSADKTGGDLLTRPDEFDRHRLRLVQLRRWLKSKEEGD